MKLCITGTDTNIGKTLTCAWLCYHLKFAYWKPIQTGAIDGTDRECIRKMEIEATAYPETYFYEPRCSPHVAAELYNEEIDLNTILMPSSKNLIIEGAGGLFVPLNQQALLIDLIKKWNVPVLLVARADLGTINHTLLSLEALKKRHILILGVILNNIKDQDRVLKNKEAIEHYGKIPVWEGLPNLNPLTPQSIKNINLPDSLRKKIKYD